MNLFEFMDLHPILSFVLCCVAAWTIVASFSAVAAIFIEAKRQ